MRMVIIGHDWGKIKVCGVKMVTRCHLVFAVFFNSWRRSWEVTFSIMVSAVIAELLSDTIMWPNDWSSSGSIVGARKPRSIGKASQRIWSTIHCLNLALFTICIHCRTSREFYWRAGWVEILMSGSVRGVDALSYGRILWHSSIEREEKQGIQSMPKKRNYITSTRPWIYL